MNVYEGLDAVSAPFQHSSVAIGTFDGVHRGHQAIIDRAVADARAHDRPALVFTFDRHPSELLRPDRAPERITTPEQRNALIAERDVDGLVIARFDASLAELTPDEFTERILKGLLDAESIVEGTDFGFGKNRAGDVNYLRRVQERYGFALHVVDPILVDGVPARSSVVRERLHAGDIAGAEAILGHPFLLHGRVVGGQRLGRTLGYPTANLQPFDRQIVPADGVYAVQVALDDGRRFGGACSIGIRPTVEGAGRAIETYLFDFNEDIYGRMLDQRFVRRLRAEEKFDDLEALTAQIARDVATARTVLAEAT